MVVAFLTMLASSVSGTVTSGGKPVADAVVSLQGSEKGKPVRGARIDQKGMRFVPHVLVVTKDTKIDFPNNDAVYHNVFAQFHAKKFDLGLYPKGSSKSIVFDRTGIVSVMCNVHSEMSAYIVVVDTPYYAVTGRDGKYAIQGVKPGKYTAKVWHESGKSGSKDVQATSSGGTFDLSLTR